jgi:small subunit ribosomal protein S20
MPNKSAGMKALRQARKRTKKNRAVKAALAKLRKTGAKALAAKRLDEARALAPKLMQAVDKAIKTGVLKPNTANRIKSRYTKALAK